MIKEEYDLFIICFLIGLAVFSYAYYYLATLDISRAEKERKYQKKKVSEFYRKRAENLHNNSFKLTGVKRNIAR